MVYFYTSAECVCQTANAKQIEFWIVFCIWMTNSWIHIGTLKLHSMSTCRQTQRQLVAAENAISNSENCPPNEVIDHPSVPGGFLPHYERWKKHSFAYIKVFCFFVSFAWEIFRGGGDKAVECRNLVILESNVFDILFHAKSIE